MMRTKKKTELTSYLFYTMFPFATHLHTTRYYFLPLVHFGMPFYRPYE